MWPLCSESSNVASCVSNTFTFSVVFSVLCATLLLFISGWLFFIGETDSQKRAKRTAFHAAAIALLLLLSYAVLNYANPELTKISTKQGIEPENKTGVEGLDPRCVDCINVVDLGVPVSEFSNIYANKEVSKKLQILYQKNKTWRVTEAFPPTVPHINTCHRDGSCVDIGVYPRLLSAKLISQLCTDAYDAGFEITNEYNDPNINLSESSCPKSLLYETTSGGHLHIK